MVDALVALEIFGNGALGDVFEAYARSPERLNVRFKAAQVAREDGHAALFEQAYNAFQQLNVVALHVPRALAHA